MGEIENLAEKIFNAYDDNYPDEDKRKIFEETFDKYLTAVDLDGKTEPYEAMVTLGYRHRADFDKMVKTLKDHSLI